MNFHLIKGIELNAQSVYLFKMKEVYKGNLMMANHENMQSDFKEFSLINVFLFWFQIFEEESNFWRIMVWLQ